MSTYIRQATRARYLALKLDDARTRAVEDHDITAVQLIDKSTGNFSLIFVFNDGTEMELTQTELTNGQRFAYDIHELRLTNTVQIGVTIKIITEAIVV